MLTDDKSLRVTSTDESTPVGVSMAATDGAAKHQEWDGCAAAEALPPKQQSYTSEAIVREWPPKGSDERHH